MYILTDSIFQFVASEDKIDLLEELLTSGSREESDGLEMIPNEKEQQMWKWNWSNKDVQCPLPILMCPTKYDLQRDLETSINGDRSIFSGNVSGGHFLNGGDRNKQNYRS